MAIPPRLRRDPDDEKYMLHCSNEECWQKQAGFRMGRTDVGLHLAASTMILVRLPDGTHQEFKKGHVESVDCANCGTKYLFTSAYDPL